MVFNVFELNGIVWCNLIIDWYTIVWIFAKCGMVEFVMILYCIIWYSGTRYGTDWYDRTWYGEVAQGGSKFRLITTQASAQPI